MESPSWRKHCLWNRSASELSDFRAAALRFYGAGHWLPASMLLDAWTSVGGGRSPCSATWQVGLPLSSLTIYRYRRWFESWRAVAARRRTVDDSPLELLFSAALPLSHLLRSAGELSRALIPDRDDRFDFIASAQLERDPTGEEFRHDETRRAFDLFESLDSVEQAFLASRLRAQLAEPQDLWRPYIDAEAVQLMEKGLLDLQSASTSRLPPARKEGNQASRAERSETGVFHERSIGRFPADVSRLDPIEHLYADLEPTLHLYRIATNSLSRTFGSRETLRRRKPRILFSVEVTERQEWAEAQTGAPWGLLSSVRAFCALLVLCVRRSAVSYDWDHEVRLDWAATTPGYGPWSGSLEGSWIESQERDDLRHILEQLPALVVPYHRAPAGQLNLGHDPGFDHRFTLEVGSRLRASSTSAGPEIRCRIEPVRPGYFVWRAPESSAGAGEEPLGAMIGRVLAHALRIEPDGEEDPRDLELIA